MRWPHKVWTLDALHCAIVQHLLRSGAVEWPGAHSEVTVVDSWRGHAGSWPWPAGSYIRGVNLVNGKVGIGGRNAHTAGTYFTQITPYRSQLEDGLCTHDEIRQVLDAAIPHKVLHFGRTYESFFRTRSSHSLSTRCSTATSSTSELCGSRRPQVSLRRSSEIPGRRCTPSAARTGACPAAADESRVRHLPSHRVFPV